MARPERPPRLADVAALAGVSVPTASRALNPGIRGEQSGHAELRQRVVDAAEQLNYSVNVQAQAVKGGRARSVGFVVSRIDDPGAATMISGLMHAAEQRDLSVAVRETLDDPEREAIVVRRMRSERHRAVILATSRPSDEGRSRRLAHQLRLLERDGCRIVLIGATHLSYPSVIIDNVAAARALAHALVDAGRRRFAVIGAVAGQRTADDRLAGFRAGLADRGIALDDDDIAIGEFSLEGGRVAARSLLDRLAAVEVVAAMSDAMAAGALSVIRSRPALAALEVSGFDRVPIISDLVPDFSTVEIPLRQFGPTALELALDGDEAEHRELPYRVVVGGRGGS